MDREQRKRQRQEALKSDPDYQRLKELLQKQSPDRVEAILAECAEYEEGEHDAKKTKT